MKGFSSPDAIHQFVGSQSFCFLYSHFQETTKFNVFQYVNLLKLIIKAVLEEATIVKSILPSTTDIFVGRMHSSLKCIKNSPNLSFNSHLGDLYDISANNVIKWYHKFFKLVCVWYFDILSTVLNEDIISKPLDITNTKYLDQVRGKEFLLPPVGTPAAARSQRPAKFKFSEVET